MAPVGARTTDPGARTPERKALGAHRQQADAVDLALDEADGRRSGLLVFVLEPELLYGSIVGGSDIGAIDVVFTLVNRGIVPGFQAESPLGNTMDTEQTGPWYHTA